MENKLLSVMESGEPWALDHEEVVRDSVLQPDGDNVPGYSGVNSGLTVQHPGGDPRCSNPERVEGLGSYPDPPGGAPRNTGSLPPSNVLNHFLGGPLVPPQSSSVRQGGVTRVEVTTGRGSVGTSLPSEHSNFRPGPALQKASRLDSDMGESITVEDSTSRDRNHVSHTTQPNVSFSVRNNVRDIEDRAMIDAFITQVGFLTEQVGNLRKDNEAFRFALQHSTMNMAAGSGLCGNSVTQGRGDPVSLPKNTLNSQNQAPASFHPTPATHSSLHVGPHRESQNHSRGMADEAGEDASIQGEDQNVGRYDLTDSDSP